MRMSLARARKLLLTALPVVSLALITPHDADAQKGKKPAAAAPKGGAKPGAKPGAGAAAAGADIELDDPATPAPAKPADTGPPPTAGQMTEPAAQAKRLFDGEKWLDAALGLYRVYKGDTHDDEGNKQLAQYHLAIALYRLKFYQAAYCILREMPRKP